MAFSRLLVVCLLLLAASHDALSMATAKSDKARECVEDDNAPVESDLFAGSIVFDSELDSSLMQNGLGIGALPAASGHADGSRSPRLVTERAVDKASHADEKHQQQVCMVTTQYSWAPAVDDGPVADRLLAAKDINCCYDTFDVLVTTFVWSSDLLRRLIKNSCHAGAYQAREWPTCEAQDEQPPP